MLGEYSTEPCLFQCLNIDKIIYSVITIVGEDEEQDEVLLRTGNYLSEKSPALPKGILDVTRVKDANCSKPSTVSCLNTSSYRD